jgi:hypothetical protein
MRKVMSMAVCFAALAAASAFAFDPSELNKITFENATGTRIETIFLSPSDSEFWGPDIIGADFVVKDGGSLGYYIHYPEETFKFDIMATDEAGHMFEVYNYVLKDGKEATITLTQKNLNSKAPDFTFATLKVTNNTGHELQYLFISPEDSDAWGVDLLDEETTLAPGDTHSIVIPVGKEKVTYNLMAADENNDEYVFDLSIDPAKGKDFKASIDAEDLKPAEGE